MTQHGKTNTKAKLAIFVCLLASTAFAGCAAAGNNVIEKYESVELPQFSLELEPGSSYKSYTRWFIFKIPIYPQVAAWLETLDGTYIGTLYVTQKAEKKNWKSAPRQGRPEALPVWSHLATENLDAVSKATSSGKTQSSSSLASRLPAGEYAVLLETNRSYDYNSVYTKSTSGVSGQPSIIYRATITIGMGPAEAVFEPLGTGSADGSDGFIHGQLNGIDTALLLFSTMSIKYRE